MSLSLRKAIDAKCRECIYDPIGGRGHWREQVEACTSRACSLHAVRPLSKRREDGHIPAAGAAIDREQGVSGGAAPTSGAAGPKQAVSGHPLTVAPTSGGEP